MLRLRQTERMSQLSIAELGTILSIWAHPDDEAYCSGAIMAAAVAQGQRVVCVTATRGELGSTDESRWANGPHLADVRTQELAACLAELGVVEHHWLDYPDGGCHEVDHTEATARVRDLIEAIQPTTVLTFGPDGGTFHPDHIAVSRWASGAVEGTDIRVLHQTNSPEWQAYMDSVVDRSLVMMTDGEPPVTPPEDCAVYVRLDGEALEQKFRALMCQESQVGPLVSLGGPEMYKLMLAEEGFTHRRDL